MQGADLRARREAIVREHLASENAHDCERAYFDQLTVIRRLGLAHDSRSLAGRLTTLVSHPLTVGRALAARVRRGRS